MQKKKEIWMLQTKRADFNGLAMRLGVSPVAVRIMRNRGLLDEREMRKYLYGTLDDLYDPRQMKGMETAAGIIEKKLIEGKKIRIIGDYDIDGVCSTYILLKGFHRAAGNGQIDYEIPDRIRDGYGINESIIRQAAEDGIDTLVTCDNGIAALKEISIAKQLGMTVVVTDHHEVPVDAYGQILPPADAVVDPKQDGETYPYHEICGAVVAWKLINVIYEDLGIPEHEWMELLEFAAIATVGDVMKLQDENRLIVKYGLKKIGSTKNTGLRMLVEKNNLDINNLSAYHIGFVIGPCLNAGGRLKSAKVALRMLLEQDPDRVSGLADELKEEFDYILMDCPAGIEQGFKNAIAGADRALVVTTPEVSAVRDADRIIGLLEANEIGQTHLIVNRLRVDMVKSGDMMSSDDVVDILAVDLIGVVPDDEHIVISANNGEPLVGSDCMAGQAYMNICKRITGEQVDFMDFDAKKGLFQKLAAILKK